MLLLNIAEGTSRVHASRRVFEQLHRQQNDIPVIHHRIFPAGGQSSDHLLSHLLSARYLQLSKLEMQMLPMHHYDLL